MTIEIHPGSSIYHAAEKACKVAKLRACNVNFTFNDIKLSVSPFSDADDIATIYRLECRTQTLQ